jgi:hypothetical protein
LYKCKAVAFRSSWKRKYSIVPATPLEIYALRNNWNVNQLKEISCSPSLFCGDLPPIPLNSDGFNSYANCTQPIDFDSIRRSVAPLNEVAGEAVQGAGVGGKLGGSHYGKVSSENSIY